MNGVEGQDSVSKLFTLQASSKKDDPNNPLEFQRTTMEQQQFYHLRWFEPENTSPSKNFAVNENVVAFWSSVERSGWHHLPFRSNNLQACGFIFKLSNMIERFPKLSMVLP